MADLDDAIDEMRRFSDRSPAPARSLGDVAAAASRHRHRRWAAASGLAVSVLLIAAAVGFWAPTGDGSVDVIDRPDPAVTSTTEYVAPPGLSIEPSRGLEDGDVVRVTGSFSPHNIAGVAICADDGQQEQDRLRWCDLSVERSPVGDALEVTVVRRIVTPAGVFDCAERPGRCLLGVRDSANVDRSAPITFRDGLEPLPTAGISVGSNDLADGELVELIGSGWHPGSFVDVRQCIGDPPSSSDEVLQSGRCDIARPLLVDADDDGWFRIGYLAYEQVYTQDGWQSCDPCSLVASSRMFPTFSRSITVSTQGDDPILPSITLTPEPPYSPGQLVSVSGSGYQRAPAARQSGPALAWCVAPADDPGRLRAFGDHDQGPCGFLVESVVVSGDGTFLADAVPLPEPPLGHLEPGSTCAPGAGEVCAVGLYVGYYFAPALAPFELVR